MAKLLTIPQGAKLHIPAEAEYLVLAALERCTMVYAAELHNGKPVVVSSDLPMTMTTVQSEMPITMESYCDLMGAN